MARSKTTPAPVPASAADRVTPPDAQPRTQVQRYQLSLRDNPSMVIAAGSSDEARAAYLAACGILATENPITCDPLAE